MLRRRPAAARSGSGPRQREPNLLLWLKTKSRYQMGHIIAPGGASFGLGSESAEQRRRSRQRKKREQRPDRQEPRAHQANHGRVSDDDQGLEDGLGRGLPQEHRDGLDTQLGVVFDLSMRLPKSTVVTLTAYGIDATRTQSGRLPERTKNVPPTISGPQTTKTAGSPRLMRLSGTGPPSYVVRRSAPSPAKTRTTGPGARRNRQR
jgi:hypothetical protein